MFKIIRYLIIFLIIAWLIISFILWRCVESSVSHSGADVVFIVSQGQSVQQISQNLKDVDLIKSKLCFKIYIRQNNKQANLQAGEYILNPNLSIKEIANALVAGQSLSKEKTIKIIEGWNVRDIDGYLNKNNIIADDSFIGLAEREIGNWSPTLHSFGDGAKLEIWKFGKPSFLNNAPISADLEGYLFPDTYRIYQDASAEDIIEKMLTNFDKKLTEETRAEINKQGKTIHQIITMASLIEKEVRTAGDMKIVSGIFWDRIKYGQAIESCATLAYILGVNKPQYTIEDTKIDSPYNTYRNTGLPPGPICNPGLSAIKAAIYPVFTDYNYFLSRPDTGETVFSKTLDEHNRNKAKYLR
ncbi:endolytic transglycosylase MltG [Candidatus Parcubacteria bacterium]|nr:endolytic transglycosylase MltG [Candidatus Parcubacteria bacterium]